MEKWHYKIITWNSLGFVFSVVEAESTVRLLTSIANLGVVSYSLYLMYKKSQTPTTAEKIEPKEPKQEKTETQ